MAALQATLASTTSLSISISRRPIFSPKIKGKYGCFASNDLPGRAGSLKAAGLARENIATANHQEVVRPLGNFPPNIWGDRFLTLPFSDSEFESCSRQVEVLKGRTKDILITSTDDPIENIFMINSLCRLGVSYHFEKQIEDQLNRIFITFPELMDKKDYDLRTTAIIFQVFRSHGFNLSCDVLNKFKNGDGLFKEELGSDIEGMISLYEACQWRMNGEVILDEALVFTTSRLESMAKQASPHLADYIAKALYRPYHRGMPRLEARQYISFYEKDESRNDILLKFAKYDFNLVQMLLQKELSLLTSWWKKSNIESMFPYVRHRLVEFYFMSVVVYFEPRFARGRDIIAKWYTAFGLIDDTYDAYGKYDELQYFTKAFDRFDIRAKDDIPVEYLKTLYEVCLNIFGEAEEEMSKERRSYSVAYAEEQAKKLVQCYDAQARWSDEGSVPTFDAYIECAQWSIGAIWTICLALIGLEEADENSYKWLINFDSKFLKAFSVLCRLYDDVVTNEAEENRQQVTGIASYMKEYGVSRKEAIEGYKEKIEVAWKEVNEGFMKPAPVSRQILMIILNTARMAEITYREDDGLTDPEITYKDLITKVLIDPIPLQE